VCTTTGSGTEARDLVAKKFFPVALVDLDVGRPAAGLDVLRTIRERSRPTALVMLTGRRSFEAAVEALRIGVDDVVVKHPDEVPRLRDVVAAATDRAHAESAEGGGILEDTVSVLDEAFRIMLDMGRKQYADVSIRAPQAFRPHILVVDGDQGFLRELAPLLPSASFEISAEMSGGGALEQAGTHRFDIVVARAELMDLQGSMVVKTIQAEHPDTLGLVYTSEGDGHVGVFREGHMDHGERPFGGAKHLVKKLEAIVEELSVTERDRRIIQAFRADHEDFFRRYAELKMRLGRMHG
jgi:DNA-binding NtrC family response regulator